MPRLISSFFLAGLAGALFLFATPAPAQAVDFNCWCQKKDGTCEKNEMPEAGGREKSQNECNQLCFDKGQKAVFFDAKTSALEVDHNTDKINPQSAEKCQPNICWCQDTTLGTCERHATDGRGYAFDTQPKCDDYCAQKKGFKSIHYDKTGIDYSKTDECKALPPKADDVPAAGGAGGGAAASDKIAELKVQAKDLNRVNFGSMADAIGRGISYFTYFIGAIAFALYIYAGILWMVAMGNSEQIEKAKNIFIWTTMGVGAILASYIVVKFLFGDVLKVIK